jgi:hypothetical protein
MSFNKRDRPAATNAARTPALSIISTSHFKLNSIYLLFIIKPYFVKNVTLHNSTTYIIITEVLNLYIYIVPPKSGS